MHAANGMQSGPSTFCLEGGRSFGIAEQQPCRSSQRLAGRQERTELLEVEHARQQEKAGEVKKVMRALYQSSSWHSWKCGSELLNENDHQQLSL